MPSIDQLMDIPYGIQCAAVLPIGILFRLQIGLEDRFEYHPRRHLRRPVTDNGYAEWPLLPIRFGYMHPSHRLRSIRLAFQFLRQFVEPSLYPVRLDVLECLAVYSRCAAVG